MDVRSLRYVVTLAQELHFTRAAAAHYIAPQPFGRRIQELERQVGAQLFERTSRRVTLTPAGQRFLPRVRVALAHIDALTDDLDRRTGGSELRVGVLGFGLADRWTATRALLAGADPGLALTYVELGWDDQYEAVRTGRVDIAVVHDVGGADDLAVEDLATIERYAVVPADSDLADADRLTDADVVDHPWITPVGQPGLVAWSGPGEPDRKVVVRSPAGVANAVAATGRLALHGEPARRFFPHPGVRYVPVEGPPAVAALVWSTHTRSGAVDAFRAAAHGSAHLGALV